METWKIYKHTNKVNGKCYIGQTCRKNPNERWNNGKGYNGTIFAKAIEKYGWDNFEHEIIEDGILSEEEANKREMYWIEYYNSYAGVSGGNGYNMTKGGDDRADKGRPVYQIDIETRKIIKKFPSALNAARETGIPGVYSCCNRDLEQCRQFVSAGGYFWCFVDEWSSNWKPKDGKITYIDKNGNKIVDCMGKQVCQIDKNGNLIKTYRTATEASKSIGIGSNSIGRCCKKERRTAGGFYWCYKKDLDNFEIPSQIPISVYGAKSIRCIELDKIFEGIRATAKLFDVGHDQLCRACKIKTLTAGGYHWEYVN